MLRIAIPLVAISLGLAACGKPAEPSQDVAAGDAAPPVAPAPVETAIPAAFLGHWDADGGPCGTSDAENPLFLEPTKLTFYESGGDVTAVRPNGEGVIDVDAAMSGEGESWNATLTFTLSEAGETLTTTQTGVQPSVRHRCQQPEGQA